MVMNIIGVDISLRSSGVVVYNSKTNSYPFFDLFLYKDKFAYDYVSFMNYQNALDSYFTTRVMSSCGNRESVLFVVEGMTNRGHFHSTIKIMLARAAMFSVVSSIESENRHCDVITPRVQEWKKDIVGKGNANKRDTFKWLSDRRTRYKVPFPIYEKDDLIDAACLVLYGRKTYLKEAIK